MRLLLLACLMGCGAARVDRVEPPIQPSTPVAGLYWIPYVTCPDDCPPPAALAAYVTRSEAHARRIKRALDGKLAFGLPWVIHTDELDDGGSRLVVPRRGIAIVIGSFDTRSAARSAAARAPVIGGGRAIVIDVASARKTESFGDEAHVVTVVDRGRRVPAWSARDIAAAEDALADTLYDVDHKTAVLRELQKQKRAPLCTVKPGELFAFRTKDLKWYEFAPVRCGGEPAYIDWTASLLGHAAIVRDKTGYRLFQVVGAMCDSPEIQDWRYDESGRHTEHEDDALVATGGCKRS